MNFEEESKKALRITIEWYVEYGRPGAGIVLERLPADSVPEVCTKSGFIRPKTTTVGQKRCGLSNITITRKTISRKASGLVIPRRHRLKKGIRVRLSSQSAKRQFAGVDDEADVLAATSHRLQLLRLGPIRGLQIARRD